MTKNMGLVGACLALLLSVSSAAVSHTVGDSTGWTQPSSPSFYPAWASKESVFNVGDFLVFNFIGGAQTVAEVTISAYDSCSAISPITQMNNGPVNVTLTSPGTHYYISTDSGHCQAGQKFLITVVDTSTPAGAKTPAASPTPMSTPPTGKGAMSPSTPAAPTPMSTPPTGKGAISPSRAMTPGTTPVSAPAMTPMSSPMAAPPSPADSPSSSISLPPASSPSADRGMMRPASSPMSGGPPAASSSDGGMMTPAGEPTSPSNSASLAGAAALILPMLLVVATSFLF